MNILKQFAGIHQYLMKKYGDDIYYKGSLSLWANGLLNTEINDLDICITSVPNQRKRRMQKAYYGGNYICKDFYNGINIDVLKLKLITPTYKRYNINGEQIKILDPQYTIDKKLSFINKYCENLYSGKELNNTDINKMKKHVEDVNYYNSKQTKSEMLPF